MVDIYILIIIIFIFTAYIHIISEVAFKKAFCAKRKTMEYEVERLKKWGIWEEDYISQLKIQDVQIISEDNLKLKGHLIENHKESNKYVILVHGYSAHYSLHMPFIKLFEDEGFNILLVEERAHGDSEGKYATYGYKESKDLDLWIHFLEKRNEGKQLYIGLHGQSMGASACIICGCRNKKVKFVVDDCGFSSAKGELEYQFESVKIANFKMCYWMTDLKAYLRAGFKFEDAEPLKEIMKSNVPILFIHGDKDKKVPCSMCINMYQKRKGKKDKILIVKDAEHLQCYMKAPEDYKNVLHEFLRNI